MPKHCESWHFWLTFLLERCMNKSTHSGAILDCQRKEMNGLGWNFNAERVALLYIFCLLLLLFSFSWEERQGDVWSTCYKGLRKIICEAVWENQSHVGKVSFEIQAQKGELGDPWSKLNEHHSRKVQPFLHILTKGEVKILALNIFFIIFCEPYHRRKLKFSLEFEDFKGTFCYRVVHSLYP